MNSIRLSCTLSGVSAHLFAPWRQRHEPDAVCARRLLHFLHTLHGSSRRQNPTHHLLLRLLAAQTLQESLLRVVSFQIMWANCVVWQHWPLAMLECGSATWLDQSSWFSQFCSSCEFAATRANKTTTPKQRKNRKQFRAQLPLQKAKACSHA